MLLAAAPALTACQANFYEEPLDERREWGLVDLPAADCVGDGDGAVSYGEMVAAPELGITSYFTVNRPGTTVLIDDPAGSPQQDDELAWDLLEVDPQRDEIYEVGPQALEEQWFAALFPDDAFATLLDGPSAMLGIYRLDDDEQALMLLGIAAEEQGDYLVYDPPVPMLRFPLEDGDGWTPADADASGVVDGEVYPRDLGDEGVVSLVHSYSFEVDGSGRVMLPFGGVEVLRVRVVHRQEAYNSIAGLFAADSSRATMFVSECLGVVARLRSQPDEVEPDFEEASESLRLGFSGELL